MAHVVAVEQVGVVAQRMQALVDQVGDGRLARARQAGEPHAARLLALELARARGLSTSRCCQWMLPARRSAKSSVPAATVALRQAVDQDEAAERRGCRHRARTAIGWSQDQVAVPDFVELQVRRRERRLRVDVDLVLERADRRADRARAELQPVRPARQHRPLRPSTARARRTGRRPAGGSSAAAITSPRLMSISSASVSITACPRLRHVERRRRAPSDARDRRTPSRRQHHDLVARRARCRRRACRRSRGNPSDRCDPDG